MKPFLKSLAIDILAIGKAFPTALTDKHQVGSLVQKLSPMNAGKELIRLGPKGDGGYLVPDDLAEIEACFSPGVGFVSDFEKDCAERGMQVFLADKSVGQPAESHSHFHFTRKHVGVTTSDDCMTLDDWVAASLPASSADWLL